MKKWISICAITALAGCGVETATTAATGAAIKKQEMDEAKKTMDRAKERIEESMRQTQQRAEKDAER